jgi:hypothetical protein
VAYYREPEGKVKKQTLNGRRSRGRKASPVFVDPASPALRGILAYLCVLVGLIEGRRVQRWEIIGMLEQTGRQHRMVRTRRLDQAVARFHERPP